CAFPAFQFRLDLAVMLSGTVETKVHIQATGGQGTLTDDAIALTHHIEQSPMPPNEARLENGMGIPVLASDGKGRLVEKEVKYTREQQERVKARHTPTPPSTAAGAK